MTRIVRTLTAAVCGLACGLAAGLALPTGPAWAAEQLTLAAPAAAPGDQLGVTGSGWPSGALVQLVTCGQLAIAGSAACDMRAALAVPVRPDGTFAVQFVLSAPPVPCPCVVHATLVGGTARGQADAPLGLTGHPMGETPTAAAAPVRLDLVEARIVGRQGWRSLFGAAATRTFVYTVHNPGPQPLPNPPLNVQFGRSGGGDRVSTPGTGDIRPGETRTYRVPVTTPFAAFGRYTVRADLGGFSPAEVTFRKYPWGLFGLHLLGAAMIVVGVARRVANRRNRRNRPPLPTMAAAPAGTLLPPVVRVGSLGAYLVFDDAPGAGRLRRRARAHLSVGGLRDLLGDAGLPNGADAEGPTGTAVIDLAALDAVLAARPGAASLAGAPGGHRNAAAVIDLTALDTHLGSPR
ncbi:hypothetical protein GCM10027280_05800 [Micromonospora polyrhachis]|uniref:Uncharacterized protein n=1 Tax=Micromonospora polyrhachis TaxID=1282883 RepID=A0A7W7SKU8_9ACTN|nr:hypothetical protein [Micromonospora polyrhachis]MBB4956511.1 hypothetical protein [Micromonospora polyrhachis]